MNISIRNFPNVVRRVSEDISANSDVMLHVIASTFWAFDNQHNPVIWKYDLNLFLGTANCGLFFSFNHNFYLTNSGRDRKKWNYATISTKQSIIILDRYFPRKQSICYRVTEPIRLRTVVIKAYPKHTHFFLLSSQIYLLFTVYK